MNEPLLTPTSPQQPQPQQTPPIVSTPASRRYLSLSVLLALFADYFTLSCIVPIVPLVLSTLDPTNVFLLFGSKSCVQILINPVAGYYTDKINAKSVFRAGLVLLMASTGVFALGLLWEHSESNKFSLMQIYYILLAARSLQGFASSFIATSGLAMVSKIAPEETRGEELGKVMGGIAMGVLTGPPIAGLVASKSKEGQATPVFIGAMAICLLSLVIFTASQHGIKYRNIEANHADDVVFHQNRTNRNSIHPNTTNCLTYLNLFCLFIATCTGNLTIALIEPILPLFLDEYYKYDKLEIGLTFASSSLCYLLGTPVFGVLADRLNKSSLISFGLLLEGVGIWLLFSSRNNIYVVIAALSILGFGISAVDTPSAPLLTELVGDAYIGRAMALLDIAVNLGFLMGPLLLVLWGDDAKPEKYEEICKPVAVLCAICVVPVLCRLRGVENVRRRAGMREKNDDDDDDEGEDLKTTC